MAMKSSELMVLMDEVEDPKEITIILAMLDIRFKDYSDGKTIDLEVEAEDGAVRFTRKEF